MESMEFSLFELPERALYSIMNDFMTLEDLSAISCLLSRKNNPSLCKKIMKIFAVLSPQDITLRSVSCLKFLVRTKIPIGRLNVQRSCLNDDSEEMYRQSEQLLTTLLPKLSPSESVPFDVTFTTAVTYTAVDIVADGPPDDRDALHDFVTDAVMLSIGKLKNLQRLVLRGCPEITDHGIVLLAWECPELRYIDISHTHYPHEENITDKSVIALSFGCKKLETVIMEEIDAISDTAVVSLSMGCRYLKELNAFYCDRLSDLSICSVGKHCSQLEKINLMYTDISDEAVISLADGCPFLKILDIERCDDVTDRSLVYMAPKLQNLHTINLRALKQITDAAVIALCEHLKHCLHTINLRDCPLIQEASIYALCEPSLRNLELPLRQEFSDEAMMQFVRSSPTLEVFHAHVQIKSHPLAEQLASLCPLLKGDPYDQIRKNPS